MQQTHQILIDLPAAAPQLWSSAPPRHQPRHKPWHQHSQQVCYKMLTPNHFQQPSIKMGPECDWGYQTHFSCSPVECSEKNKGCKQRAPRMVLVRGGGSFCIFVAEGGLLPAQRGSQRLLAVGAWLFATTGCAAGAPRLHVITSSVFCWAPSRLCCQSGPCI